MPDLSRFEVQIADDKIVAGKPVDGIYMLVAEEKKEKPLVEVDEKLFMKIEPSWISLEDKFMKHSPRTFKERCFMDLLVESINHKKEAFYCARFAPSLTEDGKSFCYEPGRMPAIGKSYTWWESEARRFKHNRESRLGTKEEYALYLATMMKKLVNAGNSIPLVWNAVCNDSAIFATYRNSPQSTNKLLPVGYETDIFGFYDLGNINKLLTENEAADSFWLASGNFSDDSRECPLAKTERTHDHSCFVYHCVGWVVFN